MVPASLAFKQHGVRYVPRAQRDLPRLDPCLYATGHMHWVLLGIFSVLMTIVFLIVCSWHRGKELSWVKTELFVRNRAENEQRFAALLHPFTP